MARYLIDNSIIIRLYRLFRIHKEIPESHIVALYHVHYKEILDVVAYGYKSGIHEFLATLRGMIYVVKRVNDVRIYALSPKQDLLSPVNDRNWSVNMQKLLDPKLNIWSAPFDKLLEMDRSKIQIDPSPLEIVLLKDENAAKSHIMRFHQVLSQHPDGVRADELCCLFENLNESFELFGAADVCSITSECFELFHVREVDGIPRVFDGRTTTDENLHVRGPDSQMLTARSILNGLYQKTLLLLSTTNGEGMKLGVWSWSVELNFGQYDPVVQPLELLKAWRDEGLLDIQEGTNFKNDLIINTPRQTVSSKYIHATKEQLIEMAEEVLPSLVE